MKVCKLDGCDDKHFAKGYCSRHYYQVRFHGRITRVEKGKKHPEICKIEGCDNKEESLGFCRAHYKKHLKYGNPLEKRTADSFEPVRWANKQIQRIKGGKFDRESCILWIYARSNDRYGHVCGHLLCLDRKRWFAHRYVIEHTIIPPYKPNFRAKNKCGNRLCVNPYHYDIKYASSNKEPTSAVKTAKLTEEQAIEIYQLDASISTASVANKYGVSQSAINNIRTGLTWRWLTKDLEGGK